MPSPIASPAPAAACANAILPYRELDAGELLDVLGEAVPDPELRHAILTRNPERLYGFGN